jgi:hypothetical protein
LSDGFEDGSTEGRCEGSKEGYSEGNVDGKPDGNSEGNDEGNDDGNDEGKAEGNAEGNSEINSGDNIGEETADVQLYPTIPHGNEWYHSADSQVSAQQSPKSQAHAAELYGSSSHQPSPRNASSIPTQSNGMDGRGREKVGSKQL